jgi:hypothetical protein
MITVVLEQGGFDTDRTTALGWLNEKYRIMVAVSRWREAATIIGTTVADQSTYPVPSEVAAITEGLIITTSDGIMEFKGIGQRELWGLQSGRLSLSTSAEGRYADSFDDEGNWQLDLWPVPDTTGYEITAFCALNPTALVDTSSSVPIVPEDTHTALIEGAIALGKARIYERYDAADRDEARFTAVVDQLSGRKLSADNSGAVQALVYGKHFW